MMHPDNGKGLPPLVRDQRASGKGQDNDHKALINVGYDNLCPYESASAGILDELEESWPLIPLRILLLSDASHKEICRALRLNAAIRLLVEAIAEADAAGVL